jgi:hypothetical protein
VGNFESVDFPTVVRLNRFQIRWNLFPPLFKIHSPFRIVDEDFNFFRHFS